MNCKNCTTELHTNFCPNCGHPATLKRIDGHYIIHEIEHLLHFEKGIFYTIKELIIRPGQNVREYLSENRSRLVKPIVFIIVTSLIYSLSNHFFHFEDGYVNYLNDKKTAIASLFKWVQSHYGYANIIMSVFIALWVKLFFRKHPFNIFEILILLCFVVGIGMMILAICGAIQGLIHKEVMNIGSTLCFIYLTWAIGNFFGERKIMNYVKAFFAYILGMLTFALAIVLIGTIIDMFLPHT